MNERSGTIPPEPPNVKIGKTNWQHSNFDQRLSANAPLIGFPNSSYFSHDEKVGPHSLAPNLINTSCKYELNYSFKKLSCQSLIFPWFLKNSMVLMIFVHSCTRRNYILFFVKNLPTSKRFKPRGTICAKSKLNKDPTSKRVRVWGSSYNRGKSPRRNGQSKMKRHKVCKL